MIALDIILLALIIICIWYCWSLSKNINALQNSKGEFETMVTALNAALSKAQTSVNELQAIGKTSVEALRNAIADAEQLHSDLLILNKVGNDLADRLEKQITNGRKVEKPKANIEDSELPLPNTKKPKQSADSAKSASKKIVHQHEDEDHPILHITTESGEKTNVDQNGYFEMLKKISTK